MNKKGVSLGDMYPAVLSIILIGIVLGIGLYILTATSEAISNEDITKTDESVAFTNNTGAAVATADDCGATDFAVVTVFNGTTNLVPSTNYSMDTLGTLLPTTDSLFIGETVLVNYTYEGVADQASTSYCGAMETSSTGIGGFASWIAVIVVVLAAAIVLGVVLSSFGRGASA